MVREQLASLARRWRRSRKQWPNGHTMAIRLRVIVVREARIITVIQRVVRSISLITSSVLTISTGHVALMMTTLILLIGKWVRHTIWLQPRKLTAFVCSNFKFLWFLGKFDVYLILVDALVGLVTLLLVLLLKEVIFVLLELFRRCHTFHGTKDVSCNVNTVISTDITFKCLTIDIMFLVEAKEAMDAVDRCFLWSVVVWS